MSFVKKCFGKSNSKNISKKLNTPINTLSPWAIDADVTFRLVTSTSDSNLTVKNNDSENSDKDVNQNMYQEQNDKKSTLKQKRIVHHHPAHKWILASVSPVLKSMFQSKIGMKSMENKMPDAILLEENEVSFEGLSRFVNLIYDTSTSQHSVHDTVDRIGTTHNPSSKKEVVVEKLIFPKDISLACEMLKLAHKYQVDYIEKYLMNCILKISDKEFNVESILLVFVTGFFCQAPFLCDQTSSWIKKNKRALQTEEGRQILSEFMKTHSDKSDLLLLSLIF